MPRGRAHRARGWWDLCSKAGSVAQLREHNLRRCNAMQTDLNAFDDSVIWFRYLSYRCLQYIPRSPLPTHHFPPLPLQCWLSISVCAQFADYNSTRRRGAHFLAAFSAISFRIPARFQVGKMLDWNWGIACNFPFVLESCQSSIDCRGREPGVGREEWRRFSWLLAGWCGVCVTPHRPCSS